MFNRFSDGQNQYSEWNTRFIPLWVSFLWICIAPFISLYRVGPLSSFYLEACSLLGAIVLVLTTACTGLLNVRLPSSSIAFFILAAFWWLQARIMELTYPGMNDMVVWTFIILALTAWACRGWVTEYSQEQVAIIFAWSLLMGSLIQALVSWLQMSGWAANDIFKGIIAYSGTNNINGQLGQRNHLGHYLMWGILATSYLWAIRRMPNWLGLALVSFLATTLGLVNSRTIFTYVIGIGVLLPLWRYHAGKKSSRIVWIFLFSILLVGIIQFSIGPILDLLTHTKYETAVERAANSGFEGSLRQIEWGKAWLAFQAAPWFGHGWNGFALQSFLINAQQQYFVNNILGVLFTHSHNIVMQLLSEMGLVGTFLVVLSFIFAIWRMLIKPYTHTSLLMLSLLTTSLCHSMLEYPLWYIYFLVPFGIMLSLSPSRHKDSIEHQQQIKYHNYIGGISSLVIIGGILHLGWRYTNLVEYSSQPKTGTIADTALKIEGLKHIANTEPMLRYYAQLNLTRRAEPTDKQIQPWAEQAAREALTYRPYANAHQVGLYLYRQGHIKEGAQWMQAMYYYYPYMMPFYATKIRSYTAFSPLLPKLLADCKTFINAPKHPTAKSCENTK